MDIVANKHQDNSPSLRKRPEKKLEGKTETPLAASTDIKAVLHELHVRSLELEIQNKELKASRDRYAELYNFGPSAFITIDASSGRILEMNFTAVDLLKTRQSDSMQKRFSSFVGTDSANAFHFCAQKAMSELCGETCEVRMHRNDGSVFWALLDVRGDQESNTIQIAVTDITEQKRVEQVKDDFIGMVSHELRTPLTVFMGAVQVARMAGIRKKEREELLKRSGRKLGKPLSHP